MSPPQEAKKVPPLPLLLREESDFSEINTEEFIAAARELGIDLQRCPPGHLQTMKAFITVRRQVLYGEKGSADEALRDWNKAYGADKVFLNDHLSDLQRVTRVTNSLSGVDIIEEAQRIVRRKK